MQAYYFSSENFTVSTIIPVTLTISDPRAICIFEGGVKSSTRLNSRTPFNLTENLQSNPKLFADDASLFATISDPNAAAKQLCADLDKIKQ